MAAQFKTEWWLKSSGQAAQSGTDYSVESTVAYNHIHVLVKTQVDPSKVGQLLFGASSRILRKEFPVLVEQIPKGLWGGKSFEPIVDKNHLDNCISYIRRHQPDNTKI